MKAKQVFPVGWDENKVQEVLAHYENQRDDEQFAETESVRESKQITMIAVPVELASEVQALLARHQPP